MAFAREYAARIYAVAAAVVTLVLVYVPGLPDAAILAVVAAVLGLGETVQMADDAKTREALFADPAYNDLDEDDEDWL
ncbi:hypothetical protein [Yinghuangia sp. YIM S09857]|uniref:hypothetical protein n=1 Tax=Yinghuangia sp. YIM S09857 TaxID=3436929 RepID=UPI003F529467